MGPDLVLLQFRWLKLREFDCDRLRNRNCQIDDFSPSSLKLGHIERFIRNQIDEQWIASSS